MTWWQLQQLNYLDTGNLPLWEKVDYLVAQKLDRAIAVIGPITITSTWRPPGGAGSAGSFHKKTPSLAIDFVPDDPDTWGVFRKLQQVGFYRIGIMPGKNAFHVDVGYEKGLANEYYFLENNSGQDLGPISAQSLATLKTIPGYGNEPEPVPANLRDLVGRANPWILLAIPAAVYYIRYS